MFYRQAVKAMGGDILDIWEVSDEAVEEEEKANALEIQSVLEEEEKELPSVEDAESVGDAPDPRDWEDFLSALSERGKAAAAAVIRTNAYAKVIEGNVLCILFNFLNIQF